MYSTQLKALYMSFFVDFIYLIWYTSIINKGGVFMRLSLRNILKGFLLFCIALPPILAVMGFLLGVVWLTFYFPMFGIAFWSILSACLAENLLDKWDNRKTLRIKNFSMGYVIALFIVLTIIGIAILVLFLF
ncbi:hypothetical protein vBLivaVAfA18_035 [Listeria phage vB_Liva_VAfA18]|uniref:Uncharacterized protein n=1 Tax=Listeria phage vB_Liva_VAfA18 TaxID=2712945 RepID=A0A858EB56_9CAUD|nr:hypothetical protein vBLivaVAfA18_035 [Listeria phage vB_Liva_VAfA18]